MSIEKKTILYISLWPWDDLWQRPQHIALNLSNTYNVIFTSAIPFKSKNGKFKIFNKTNINKISDSLKIISYHFYPSYIIKFLKYFNYYSWLISIKQYLNNSNTKFDILWVSSPDHLFFCDKFKPKIIIYDCMDNFGMFDKNLIPLENELFKIANIVFTSAFLIKLNAINYNSNVHLVPNAVDVKHFSNALTGKLKEPIDLLDITGNKIGFYGNLGTWLDYSIIKNIAENTTYSIVLIGSLNSEDAKKVTKLKNVYFLGEKPYSILPNYLAHINLWILPFLDNDLTKSVDPVKIYEYLAAGRDVVASPLPSLIQHKKYITITTPEKFTLEVSNFINQPKNIFERLIISKQMEEHTWAARVNKINKILLENL